MLRYYIPTFRQFPFQISCRYTKSLEQVQMYAFDRQHTGCILQLNPEGIALNVDLYAEYDFFSDEIP